MVIGKKSGASLLGFIIVIFVIVLCIVSGISLDGVGGLLLIPGLIALGFGFYYGYFVFFLPNDIVYINSDTKEIKVMTSKDKQENFHIRDIEKIEQTSCGPRGSKARTITFTLKDGKEVTAPMIAEPDNVANSIMNTYKDSHLPESDR